MRCRFPSLPVPRLAGRPPCVFVTFNEARKYLATSMCENNIKIYLKKEYEDVDCSSREVRKFHLRINIIFEQNQETVFGYVQQMCSNCTKQNSVLGSWKLKYRYAKLGILQCLDGNE
jgi:hypothetical protein